jgi:hypothetical protein
VAGNNSLMDGGTSNGSTSQTATWCRVAEPAVCNMVEPGMFNLIGRTM